MEVTENVNNGEVSGQSAIAPVLEPAINDSNITPDSGNGAEPKEGISAISGEGAAATPPPAWQPNYKFKAFKKEKEIDEWARPLIKDKESEDKVRELFEKAYGLDEVKNDRETIRTKLKETTEQFNQVQTGIKQLESLLEAKDYRKFFQALDIPKEDILRYAIEEVKYAELPPEQRAQIEAQRAEQERARQLEYENKSLQQRHAEAIAIHGETLITQELMRPEVAKFAQEFDTRMGTPGAFKLEVIKRGYAHEQLYKQALPPSQIVDELLRVYGVAPTPQANGIGNKQPTQVKPPVIPVVNAGTGNSPVKKGVKDISDIQALYKQKMAEQGIEV